MTRCTWMTKTGKGFFPWKQCDNDGVSEITNVSMLCEEHDTEENREHILSTGILDT